MRIGFGYDVHELVEGRSLILGGCKIPYEKGLLGHSDADVLVHAIIDSLLGAAALGDIGRRFPDSAREFEGISSIELLNRVYYLLLAKEYCIINVDTTIVAQNPKLAAYISSMREKIAKTLSVSVDQINIKATTEEGLGFTGSGKGIAAYAVCMIDKIEKK